MTTVENDKRIFGNNLASCGVSCFCNSLSDCLFGNCYSLLFEQINNSQRSYAVFCLMFPGKRYKNTSARIKNITAFYCFVKHFYCRNISNCQSRISDF